MSEENDKAQAAFVKALGEMSNPPKNRVVNVPGKYTFQYADLAIILDTVRPVLAKNGLAITQPVKFEGDKILVVTKIRHTSGVIVEEATLEGKNPGTPQQQGSLISYLRRYQLVSILGITADDDDDANAAQGQPADHYDRAPRPAPKAPPIEPKADTLPEQFDGVGQVKEVRALVTAIKERVHVDRLKDLTALIQAYCAPTRDAQGKITAYVGTIPADPTTYKTLCTKLADFK
jgi:hypothetical protein